MRLCWCNSYFPFRLRQINNQPQCELVLCLICDLHLYQSTMLCLLAKVFHFFLTAFYKSVCFLQRGLLFCAPMKLLDLSKVLITQPFVAPTDSVSGKFSLLKATTCGSHWNHLFFRLVWDRS